MSEALNKNRPRVLIFIVAYNAERTIQAVLRRIDPALTKYDTHILIIDDSSGDLTFERARDLENAPFPTTVLFNPVNQGYGGNQKIGFHYAIKEGFDFVALLHGDGQYAPEYLAHSPSAARDRGCRCSIRIENAPPRGGAAWRNATVQAHRQ